MQPIDDLPLQNMCYHLLCENWGASVCELFCHQSSSGPWVEGRVWLASFADRLNSLLVQQALQNNSLKPGYIHLWGACAWRMLRPYGMHDVQRALCM